MSRPLKIGLGIGIPVLALVLILGYFFVDSNTSGSGAYPGFAEEYSRDADDGTFGLAVVEQAGFANKEKNENLLASNPQSTAASGSNASDQVQERLIIKTGNMSLVVENVRNAVKKISDYAIEKGGFVVTSDISKSGVALYGNVTVRIPVESFDEGVEQVKTFGEVTSQRVDGQDVTEEYVDLDAQLKNYRATEEQFLEIMKRAFKIEDILAVQKELTWVRGEIERIEGSMKYLRQSADLSTLTVHLSTDPNVLPAWDEEDQWKPWAVVKQAVRGLIDDGQILVNLLIWLVVYIPLWAIIGLVVWLIVRVVKRRRNSSTLK